MEFVVGTISLSCELFLRSCGCFRSCRTGTIVYGGVLFYMRSAAVLAVAYEENLRGGQIFVTIA